MSKTKKKLRRNRKLNKQKKNHKKLKSKYY